MQNFHGWNIGLPRFRQLEFDPCCFMDTLLSPPPPEAAVARPISTPQRARMARESAPLISVIIPAHNEERYIAATLQALKAQTWTSFEVIVVANACTDETVAVARNHCDKLVHLPERGLSRARNLGARLARGKLLLFLDADTLLAPDALEQIAHQFSARHAAGTVQGRPDTVRFSHAMLYFWKNLCHRFRWHEGSSGVILCWKWQFESAGGFDEMLHLRENSDLMRRLRCFGRYAYIHDAVAVTSMRRYSQRGFWKTAVFWMKVGLRSAWGDIRNREYDVVR